MKRNESDMPADFDLDAAILDAEQGEAGKLLAHVSEEIEPSPEFEQRLEARLRARMPGNEPAPLPDNRHEVIARQAAPSPATRPAARLLQPGANGPTPSRLRWGRAVSVVAGLSGLAALVIALVGMATILRMRQEAGKATPTASGPVVSGDVLSVVSSMVHLRTLDMGRAVSMAWSADGRHLAAVEWPGPRGSDYSRPLWPDDKVEVKLWDAQTGTLLTSGGSHGYIGVSWSPDGKFVSYVVKQVIDVFDNTDRFLYLIASPNSTERAAWVAWSPDSRYIATSFAPLDKANAPTPDSTLRIYEATTGRLDRTFYVAAEPSPTPDPKGPPRPDIPTGWILQAKWSPDGKRLLVNLDNGVASVIDAANGQELMRGFGPGSWGVYSSTPDWAKWGIWYDWSPDGRYLYGWLGPYMALYDGATGRFVRSMPEVMPPPVPSVGPALPGTPTYTQADYWDVNAFAWSPDGKKIATAANTMLRIWDANTGTKLYERGIYGSNSMVWSAEGRVLAVLNGGLDEGRVNTAVVMMLDTSDWSVVRTISDRDQQFGTFNGFAWSPDNRAMAISAKDGVQIWGAGTPEPTETPGGPETPTPSTPQVPSAVPSAVSTINVPPGTPGMAATPTPIPGGAPTWTPAIFISPTPRPGPTWGAEPTYTPTPEPTQATATPVCGTWSLAGTPAVDNDSQLLAVSAASPSDVWAVGYHATGSQAYIGPNVAAPDPERTLAMHWDGKQWTPVSSPNVITGNNRLTGVAAISKNDAWAVGYTGWEGDDRAADKSQTIIMHWDGTHWRLVSSPNVKGVNNRLLAVLALSSTDVWAVGHSGGGYGWDATNEPVWSTLVLHWDGAAWKQVPSANPGPYGNMLYALSGTSPDDLWAVGMQIPRAGGGGGGMNPDRLVLHWNGKEWQDVPTPGDANRLTGVDSLSPSDTWAVGANAQEGRSDSKALHWDGKEWATIDLPVTKPGAGEPPPQDTITGIAPVSSHEAWAVGGYTPYQKIPSVPEGLLMHWDGSIWAQVGNPTGLPGVGATGTPFSGLNAVAALPTGEAWAVGSLESGATEQQMLILSYSPSGCPRP